ncbi:MAG: hypothetical protein U0792_07930 [Gemmataceae bacterium]
MASFDGGSITGHVGDILAVAKQAHAAGDTVLARRLIAHCRAIENSPGDARGTTTLVLSDGRRVPVHEAAKHIRGGKPAGTVSRAGSAASSPIAAEMRRISAKCRKLSSEADQRRIGAALAEMNKPVRQPSRQSDDWDPDEDLDREIFGDD